MPAQPLLEDARHVSSQDSAPAIAIRIPVRVVGMIVLGLVAIIMVSLASWQVDDPSFSYASGQPARNWLGFPGAVIADLSFQVFGLGMLAVLVPPALWGWSFIRLRVPSRMGLRLIAWIGASLLEFVAHRITGESPDPQTLIVATRVEFAGDILWAVSALFAIAVILRITGAQRRALRRAI